MRRVGRASVDRVSADRVSADRVSVGRASDRALPAVASAWPPSGLAPA